MSMKCFRRQQIHINIEMFNNTSPTIVIAEDHDDSRKKYVSVVSNFYIFIMSENKN